jgi:hypothetical protein
VLNGRSAELQADKKGIEYDVTETCWKVMPPNLFYL